MFANHISDERHVFSLYKEVSKLTKMNTPNEKWANDLR